MAENETIKERIYRYLDFKRITPSRFEKTIKAGGSYLKNVRTIGSDKLLAISENYADLNIDWLVTGRGGMLISELPNSESGVFSITESQQRTIETLSKVIESLTNK
jgi:hypothetical protein